MTSFLNPAVTATLLPPGTKWRSGSREAASVDPHILITPDPTLDAKIIRIAPPHGIDEQMIVPQRKPAFRKP